MDVLKAMTIFVEVANQQGFAPAARALELSTSAVSRYVIELEEWLGIQLFHRTTRKLSLTEEGALYLSRCQLVICDVDDIKQSVSGNLTEPQGKLRITAPVFIAKAWLQDLLPGYLNRYPQVSVELTAVDRFVDLVAEGYDIALRAGELADSTLIARRLMDVDLALVASPVYLAEYGTPASIDDLKSHNCLIDTVSGYANRWPLFDGKKRKSVSVSGNVRVNSGEIVRSLAIAGIGIALLPRFLVLKDIHDSRLVSFLESSIDFRAGLYAVYPQRRHVSANIRCFIDYLVGHLDQLKILYE
jgi:DNA-binding transcriptional LysR family regulator